MKPIPAHIADRNDPEAVYGSHVDALLPGCDPIVRLIRCDIMAIRDVAAKAARNATCSELLFALSRVAMDTALAPIAPGDLAVARMGMRGVLDGIRWIERVA